MQKLLFTFMALFLVVALSAQNARFGVTAGAVISSQKFSSQNVSITGDSKVGFTIGVVADLEVSDNFSFQPGLNFLQKGTKFGAALTGGGTETLTLNYLELPLNGVFKVPTGPGSVVAGLGPVLSYGLSGKDKSDQGDVDVHFGSGTDDEFKPFEFGGNILAGYQLNSGLMIVLNYNFGFSNIANNQGGGDGTAKNHYFGIRLGWLFGGTK